MPKVSVIMPVYNCASFLTSSIDSILAQTFQDFELICVDDASTDDSWSIIQSYAARDPRVIALRHKQNKGASEARNTGLDHARGEYVAVQDADDRSLSNRLETQVMYLDTHPEAGAVAGAANRVDAQSNVLSTWSIPNTADMIRGLLMLNCPLPHTTMMARRALVQQVGGYTFGHGNDDYHLWWELSRITQIHPIQEVLAHYHDDDQDTRRWSVGRAKEQLLGSQEISLRVARDVMRGDTLDEDAYKRFFLSSRGVKGSLRRGDVRRLRPLWDKLADDPVYRLALGPKLVTCGLKNWRASPLEALNLLLVAQRKFQIGWLRILKRTIRYFFLDPFAPRENPIQASS